MIRKLIGQRTITTILLFSFFFIGRTTLAQNPSQVDDNTKPDWRPPVNEKILLRDGSEKQHIVPRPSVSQAPGTKPGETTNPKGLPTDVD